MGVLSLYNLILSLRQLFFFNLAFTSNSILILFRACAWEIFSVLRLNHVLVIRITMFFRWVVHLLNTLLLLRNKKLSLFIFSLFYRSLIDLSLLKYFLRRLKTIHNWLSSKRKLIWRSRCFLHWIWEGIRLNCSSRFSALRLVWWYWNRIKISSVRRIRMRAWRYSLSCLSIY